jgi:hypothetical protein
MAKIISLPRSSTSTPSRKRGRPNPEVDGADGAPLEPSAAMTLDAPSVRPASFPLDTGSASRNPEAPSSGRIDMHLRLRDRVHKKLSRIAHAEGLSFNDVIDRLIRQAPDPCASEPHGDGS